MFSYLYHGKVLNLNIDNMKKNKPSLCDALDIMREMMCKLPKKSSLTRNSCKNLSVSTQRINQKGLIRFVLHTGL